MSIRTSDAATACMLRASLDCASFASLSTMGRQFVGQPRAESFEDQNLPMSGMVAQNIVTNEHRLLIFLWCVLCVLQKNNKVQGVGQAMLPTL
jgi:hypothetical protein